MERRDSALVPPMCGLCQMHQKLETNDGTAFWIEWGQSGWPRLCMDSTTRGGGLNVLQVEFCPICGRKCGKLEKPGGNVWESER